MNHDSIRDYKAIIEAATNLKACILKLQTRSNATNIFVSAIEKYIELASYSLEVEEVYAQLMDWEHEENS